MRFIQWMQPRDHGAAARIVSALAVVGVGVTILLAPIAPGVDELDDLGLALLVVTIVVVALLSLLARFLGEAHVVAWSVCPLLALSAIVELDLLTTDASVGAQIFLFFPTLYAASQLRPPGAVVVTVASIAGEALVVGTLLPLREAATCVVSVGAALATTAVLLVRSAESQARLVAKLERQAAIDPLTGLVTRRVLDQAATSALSGAASEEGTSLILLDIDGFKSINDRFGHPGGDEVLRQLATLLMRSARRNDVVSRMGGDEIALLLPGCSRDDLHRRAEQIVSDVRTHPFVLGPGVQTTVSVSAGLAHAPTQAGDLPALYAAADAALYGAKEAGRDRVGTGRTPADPPPPGPPQRAETLIG